MELDENENIVLYNPELLPSEAFPDVHFEKYADDLDRYMALIDYLFSNPEDEREVKSIEYVINGINHSLFEDFVKRLEALFPEDAFFRKALYVSKWFINTHDTIIRGYKKKKRNFLPGPFSDYHEEQVSENAVKLKKWQDFADKTQFFLIIQNWWSFSEFFRKYEDELNRMPVIPYNLWGDELEQKEKEYGDKPLDCLLPIGKAVKSVHYNRIWFKETIEPLIKLYDDYIASCVGIDVIDPEEPEEVSNFKTKLLKLYDDYVKRLHDPLMAREYCLMWYISTFLALHDASWSLVGFDESDLYGKQINGFVYRQCFPILIHQLSIIIEDIEEAIKKEGVSRIADADDCYSQEERRGSEEAGKDSKEERLENYLTFKDKVIPETRAKIYTYLGERIGHEPNYKDYSYLAALREMDLVMDIEYKKLQSAFPDYTDKQESNFNNFLRETGFYRNLDYTDYNNKRVQRVVDKMTDICKTIPAIKETILNEQLFKRIKTELRNSSGLD